MVASILLASIGLATLDGALGRAAPRVGQTLPDVSVQDLDGKSRTLPDKTIAVVIIYEDSNAGKQNARASDLIDRTTDVADNKSKIEAVAVADVAKWNWWPAKRFATKEMKKIEIKERCTLFTDWHGGVRKAWGLDKGKSGILVVGTDGVVHFVGQGPLTDAQLVELRAAMIGLGVTVPTPNADAASKHDAPNVKAPPGAKLPASAEQ